MMDFAAEVSFFRQLASSMMSDVVLVERRNESPVTDPVTGVVSYPSMAVYEGRGYIQVGNARGESAIVAGADLVVQQSYLHVPFDTALQVGDEVTVSESVSSPLLVGRRWRVTRLLHKSRATAHRAVVEEIN